MKGNTNTNRVTQTSNFHGRVSFLFMLLICTLIFNNATGSTILCLDANKCSEADTNSLKFVDKIEEGIVFEGKRESSLAWAIRFPIRIGSSPPHCTSKCGECKPCKLISVQVKSGSTKTGEDNPLVWKCKCGNKLYDPSP